MNIPNQDNSRLVVDKRGDITSIIHNGSRIRLSTIGAWLKLHKDCRVQRDQLIYVGWDVGTGRVIIILAVGQVLALRCENEHKVEIIEAIPRGRDVESLVKGVEIVGQ